MPCPSICFYLFHLFSWVVPRDVYLLFWPKPGTHILLLAPGRDWCGEDKMLVIFFSVGWLQVTVYIVLNESGEVQSSSAAEIYFTKIF